MLDTLFEAGKSKGLLHTSGLIAKVEYHFVIIKRIFGFVKTRYKGKVDAICQYHDLVRKSKIITCCFILTDAGARCYWSIIIMHNRSPQKSRNCPSLEDHEQG